MSNKEKEEEKKKTARDLMPIDCHNVGTNEVNAAAVLFPPFFFILFTKRNKMWCVCVVDGRIDEMREPVPDKTSPRDEGGE